MDDDNKESFTSRRQRDGGRAGFEKREKRRTIRQLHSAITNLEKATVAEILESDFDVDFQYNGQTSLQVAVCQGALDICELLLAKGADVNHTDASGNSLLNMACWRGFKQIASLLVGKGANVDAQNESGNTPLNGCAWKGFKDIAQILLDAKCDTNLANKKGVTPLHTLCQSGNAEMVTQFLEGGADPNWFDQFYDTPLMMASKAGHPAVVKALLQKDAKINLQNRNGFTAVFQAASEGHHEIIRVLAQHGADLNISSLKGVTPLLEALEKDHPDCVRTLVACGCNVNQADRQHQAPLHTIVRTITSMFLGQGIEEKYELVRLLVDAGADVNQRDFNGQTVLLMALLGGDIELSKYLVSKGSDLTVVTNEGMTMLHGAVNGGNLELVKLCIDAGCDVNAVNKLGQSALILAVTARADIKMIETLLDSGSNVNQAVTFTQHTALHEAMTQHYEAAAKLLIDRGIDLCAINRERKTALYMACQRGLVDTVRVMLSTSKCPMSSQYPSALPIHAAAANGRTPCIEVLAEFGCDINQLNEKGQTPLTVALDEDSFSSARALLQCGCDIEYQHKLKGLQLCCLHQEDSHPHIGLEPLFLAMTHKNLDAIKMLLACYRYIPSKVIHVLAMLLRTTQGLNTHYTEKQKREITTLFSRHLRIPFTLADACRRCVRSCLSSPIQSKVKSLPVAEKVKRFILMEEEFAKWKELEQEMPGGSSGFSDIFVHRHRW